METVAPESTRSFTPVFHPSPLSPSPRTGEPPEGTSGAGASLGCGEAGARTGSRTSDRLEGNSPSAAPRTLSPELAAAAGALLHCLECKNRGFCCPLFRAPPDRETPGCGFASLGSPPWPGAGGGRATPPRILGQASGIVVGVEFVVITSALPLRS